MGNNNGMWSEEEIKALFKFVEIKKNDGVPLINIFKQFAQKVGRMQNSVRNYYYKEVTNLLKNKERSERLGINIQKHKVLEVKSFSRKDEEELKNKVEELRSQGNSVRKSCLILANGDATKMIRIQNKYRALIKEESKKVNNVIKMPIKKNILNDEDINSLFLGLVKLVKKQEFEKVKLLYEGNLSESNNKLKNAIAGLIEKDNKIEQLKKQIKLLESQTEILKRNVVKNGETLKKKNANKLLNEYFKNEEEKRYEIGVEKNI